MLAKLHIHLQKNEIRSISFTLHRNLFEANQRLKFKTRNAETARGILFKTLA